MTVRSNVILRRPHELFLVANISLADIFINFLWYHDGFKEMIDYDLRWYASLSFIWTIFSTKLRENYENDTFAFILQFPYKNITS